MDKPAAIKQALEFYSALGFKRLPIADVDIKPAGRPVAPRKSDGNHATGLENLRAEIGDCQRCKLSKGRKNIVYGEGNPDAELMFIGEGPGEDEDIQGRPFVGKAGQLLTSLIENMGLRREDVYIANIVKCRPPGNRNPEEEEINSCIGFIKLQIEIISPRVIVALGNISVQALSGRKMPITKIRGRFMDYNGIKLMPTFHPAYLLRNPKDKVLVKDDAVAVLKELGLPIPPKWAGVS